MKSIDTQYHGYEINTILTLSNIALAGVTGVK